MRGNHKFYFFPLSAALAALEKRTAAQASACVGVLFTERSSVDFYRYFSTLNPFIRKTILPFIPGLPLAGQIIESLSFSITVIIWVHNSISMIFRR